MFECVCNQKHLIRACEMGLQILSVVTVTARSLITKPTTRIWETSFADQHDLYVESKYGSVYTIYLEVMARSPSALMSSGVYLSWTPSAICLSRLSLIR